MAEQLVSHYRRTLHAGRPSYTTIGEVLGLGGCIGSDGRIQLEGSSPKQLLRAITGWLSSENNTQWLVIFDNNDDIKSMKHTDIIPVGEFGSVIFSTRNSELHQCGEGIQVREIEPDAGIRILLRSAGMETIGFTGLIHSSTGAVFQGGGVR